VTFEEFTRHAHHGNMVPVSLSIPADTFTPVSAFLQLSREQRFGFLLESVAGGERMARYSFLGFAPRFVLRYSQRFSSAQEHHERVLQMHPPDAAVFDHDLAQTDIFTCLQNFSKKFRPVAVPGLPRFTGGFVGYFGYDTVRDLEKLQPPPHWQTNDAEGLPTAEFGFYDTVLAFDHVQQRMLLITDVFLQEGELNLRRRYEEAVEKLEALRAQLQTPAALPQPPQPQVRDLPEPRANIARRDFLAAVAAAKEHIAAGDIFQVVLSQRFSCAFSAPPFQLYRALRQINPSPYMFFLKLDDNNLIGASPEALLRVENRVAEMRPIAGTRRRGAEEDEDRQLENDLRADPKECAEHLMLVDLSRNDLGRVCEFAGVQVNELMNVERYSHVMHMVSNVRGTLRAETDAIDALRACFPAGTVSGAPKIRAMEIIDALEPEPRGPYAGAVGYLDFFGNLDTCITIRTVWTHGNQAYFQAGAGIVADSDPAREYQETIEKSRVVWQAIDLAERGLLMQ
jgi:anthranilate synthase component 1